jgi:dihydroorotate dehydrogenase (NAD+) catalytic subunit
MRPDLSVSIGKLTLKNPVMVASGTFGYGEEYEGVVELNKLGAIVVKAVTLNPTPGNPQPRIMEVTAGMINSIGLQNEGVDYFIEKKIPIIKEYGVPIIVNIAGTTVKEYKEIAQKLDKVTSVAAFEINISCPNVKEGGMQFGTDPKWTNTVVKNVRGVTEKPIITKLSPNVTDIVKIAESAQDGGSDAVSLVNTFKAMAIDIETKKPVLATIAGGLSGPCIKPIALRMVWETAKKIDIPVIGMGGIMNTNDALEFIIAGASAVQIGTANFTDPMTAVNVIDGIEDYLKKNNVPNVRLVTGSLVTG